MSFMQQDVMDIKFSRLFPWHFLFLALIVGVSGLALITERTILSLCLIIASGLVITASSGTEINRSEKTYKEYHVFFFVLKTGSKIKYTAIEKLYITRAKVTQTMYSRTNHSASFSDIEYNAYIKFVNGTKVRLLNNRDKTRVVASLKKISAFLGVTVEDHAIPTS
jgi:hypothetical protein